VRRFLTAVVKCATFSTLAFLLLLQSTTRGQSGANPQHLYLPFIHSAGTSSIGIALTNPTLESVDVVLTARSYAGTLITGSDITNPATVALPPRGQRALQLTEIFGGGISGRTGWVDLTASVPVQGLFILFNDALTAIDGGGFADAPVSRLIFPKVTPDTVVSFANTSSKPINKAVFRVFDIAGRFQHEKLVTIEAYSGFSGPLSDLIPDAGSFSGYAELDTAGSIFGVKVDSLVGFETYRNRADIAAMAAVPAETGVLRNGYIAHFISQGGFYTNLGLVNPTSQPQRVRISVSVSGDPVTVERTIPATGKLEERADQLFGFTGDTLITGSMRYEVQDQGNGLIGYVEYGTTDGLMLTAVAAQGSGLSDIFFSQIAEGGGFYTGLALLNPNVVQSSVTIEAFDRDGRRVASTAVTLDAGARLTKLIPEIFPAIRTLTGGYIHVTASRGVVAYELFGSSSFTNVLANVPARGVQLQPQSSGRPVIAARGGIVVSTDGQASVMVPPGALASDLVISVESIAYADLPNPAADLRIAGAVEAKPAGLKPRMPLKVMFPLAVQLPRDTSLPVLFFNPQTRLYEPTEFTAVVGESGRTAFVDVTHFSTFVVALPDRDLIKVTGITPSSGSHGATVRIDGEGFNPNANDNAVWFAGADNTTRFAAVTAATANTLTVTVPPGAVTGYVTVRVGERSSLGVVFTVPQEHPRPVVSSVSPDSVLTGSAVELAIAGTGFEPESRVTYDDGVFAATYVDHTLLLLALEPAQLNPAVHRIAVRNPAPGGGTSNTVELKVLIPRPTLSSVTPDVFDEGETGFVTLAGSGFTSESLVMLDGSPVPPTFLGPNTLRLPFTAFTIGNHSVAVLNPAPGGGLSGSLSVRARSAIGVTGIRLTDPASGGVLREVVVNEGNTVQPGVQVIDSTGAVTQTFQPTYTSLDTSVATVDSAGNIRGVQRGFSTLVVSAGSAVTVATVAVVGVDAGPAGIEVTGLAQDYARRVYLASAKDHIILRSDDLTQSPSLYAGVRQNPGLRNDLRLQSWFRNPGFLALNQAEGSLYVADAANQVIRRISPGNSGTVMTLAGTGTRGDTDGPVLTAAFNNPQGVALDARGALWVADSGNHTIRRIDLVAGTVQTIAGQSGVTGLVDGRGAAARFKEPMGLAIEGESEAQQVARERAGLPPPPVRVIVADSGNGAIRRVNENGDVETLQVASFALSRNDGTQHAAFASGFASPTGVAVDPLGNIYVTEAASGAVRTILTNGDVVSAVQPNTFINPHGIAITGVGRVLIAGSNRAAQELRYGEPEITSITPERAPNGGNTLVTVEGRNFAPGTVVLVGGVLIPQAAVETTQRIRFFTPALPSGITTVTVQNRGGIAQRSWIVDPLPLAQMPAGRITTIAGGATFVGDGLDAKSASLLPWKAVVDNAGNLYVVDYLHNRVRKVSAATGIITTIAGTGTSSFSGDGGLATAATLNGPRGLAIDAAGNLYIADSGNNRIRKLSLLSGIITTVAGDGISRFTGDGVAAIFASLSIPADVAVDATGNLIVADTGNNRIRKVDPGGIITTIAGNGTQQTGAPANNVAATSTGMSFPRAVTVDPVGRVYVADTSSNTVRRIDLDGTIHTIAGTGVAGSAANQLRQPQGLALDSSGNLFIADTLNDRVQKLDAGNNAITTIAGTGQIGFSGDNGPAVAAKLNFPLGLAIDAAGDLYIADAFNRRLRKVAAQTGIITTFASNGEFGYLGDSSPATAAGLNYPQGIAFDGSGNLYVSDTNRIRRIAAATGIITTIAGDGNTGFATNGTHAAAATLNNPTGVVVDAIGNILFADTGSNRILRIDAGTGALSTVAGTGGQGFSGDNGAATFASLNGPLMLALDGSGSNLYFSDSANQRIRKVNLATGIITTAAGNGSAGFGGDGGQATSAALNYPFGVALDAANNLFITEIANGVIRKVSAATGVISTIAGINSFGFGGDGGPATQARLHFPLGMAFDSQGNLYFADAGNARIRRIAAATNSITTVAGNGQGGLAVDNVPAGHSPLAFPTALQFDGSGNLIFTDPSPIAARIRAIKAPIP
jgi:sugar lactone lactonase YvrE